MSGAAREDGSCASGRRGTKRGNRSSRRKSSCGAYNNPPQGGHESRHRAGDRRPAAVVLRDERRTLTVSRVQEGTFGGRGVALSLPAIVRYRRRRRSPRTRHGPGRTRAPRALGGCAAGCRRQRSGRQGSRCRKHSLTSSQPSAISRDRRESSGAGSWELAAGSGIVHTLSAISGDRRTAAARCRARAGRRSPVRGDGSRCR